jgi:hypothetical protein
MYVHRHIYGRRRHSTAPCGHSGIQGKPSLHKQGPRTTIQFPVDTPSRRGMSDIMINQQSSTSITNIYIQIVFPMLARMYQLMLEPEFTNTTLEKYEMQATTGTTINYHTKTKKT